MKNYTTELFYAALNKFEFYKIPDAKFAAANEVEGIFNSLNPFRDAIYKNYDNTFKRSYIMNNLAAYIEDLRGLPEGELQKW